MLDGIVYIGLSLKHDPNTKIKRQVLPSQVQNYATGFCAMML